MAKAYTAFLFKFEPDHEKLHVTHQYFGEITRNPSYRQEADTIVDTVNSYFATLGRTALPVLDFCQEDFFSPSRDIRVLKQDANNCFVSLLPDLRVDLDRYVSESAQGYPMYIPHVTTDYYRRICAPFGKYVLVVDKKIYRAWDL